MVHEDDRAGREAGARRHGGITVSGSRTTGLRGADQRGTTRRGRRPRGGTPTGCWCARIPIVKRRVKRGSLPCGGEEVGGDREGAGKPDRVVARASASLLVK